MHCGCAPVLLRAMKRLAVRLCNSADCRQTGSEGRVKFDAVIYPSFLRQQEIQRMFIGFIPVLVAFVAALTSLRNQKGARLLWFICALLVIRWTLFHGRHHLHDLSTLGSW
jgi:hypothetical protein